jgi:DSF synthase
MDMNIPQPVLNLDLSSPLSEQAPPTLRAPGTDRPTEFFFSDQLCAFHDTDLRAMWLRWNPAPRPNFNLSLLTDLSRYCHFLSNSESSHNGGRIECNAGSLEFDYAVLASAVKGVFNLGGDLNLFTRLIESQDYERLLNYGHACINVLYQNYISYGLPITTISLVQGECLGGGFEAALSSDVLIAEKSARFGFPEILFNLFPGMGAYSFLERKIGSRKTEELIASGRIYSADDMLGLGLVDVVAEDGKGEAAIAATVAARRRSRSGLVGLAAARRAVHRLEYEELNRVVESWVDTALRLSARDLKLMQRLVSRQDSIQASQTLH